MTMRPRFCETSRLPGQRAAQTRLAAIDAHNGLRAQALAKLREVIAQHQKEMTARLLFTVCSWPMERAMKRLRRPPESLVTSRPRQW
jgi:hypothetical protein